MGVGGGPSLRHFSTASVTVIPHEVRFMGFSFRESAAAAAVATIIFRDGTSTAGDLVVVEEFAGNRGITHWFGPLGIEMEDGIFLDRIAGQTKGSVWTG